MIWRNGKRNCGGGGAKCAPGASRRPAQAPHDRGIALVITLLLLFLLSIVGLAAVLTTSSDLLINGYYSNYRGSFYAADSGLNIARQYMANALQQQFNQYNTSLGCTYPLPANSALLTLGPTIATQVNTLYGGSTNLNAGTGANSWQESFQITSPTLSFAGQNPGAVFQNPVPNVNTGACVYIYSYSLTSVGSATGYEQNSITESGAFEFQVSPVPASYSASYSIFGAFITNYPPCLGPLVPGTMTGTMFTDGAWGFMPGGSYIFTDPVGQADANASWFDSYWNCWQGPGPSYTAPDGQVIAPNFQGGFSVGQPSITQPSDSYSQEWAAIDGKGTGENTAQPGNAQLNQYLQSITGAPYPANGAASGVYFNAQQVNGVETIAGGGLYIEGNASIELIPTGASSQEYVITQGSTVTTLTVNPTANTTTLTSGSNSVVLKGVPTNTSVAPAQQGTIIYVDGTITSLYGPGEGMGAIQNGQAITIAAAADVNITGDVRYVTEPVTTAPNQIPGAPVATLIPGNNNGQDLGIFTSNGSIILSSPYPDDNLWVDGSQAVIGSNCQSWQCGFYVNGCINTFNNVGGQIQTNIFGACMNIENTYYDRRYTSVTGFSPPWFPSTTITPNPSSPSPTTPNIQRLSWVSSSGQ